MLKKLHDREAKADETAVRSQDIIVRSSARRVRTLAIWLSAVIRASNRLAIGACFGASGSFMAGLRNGSRHDSYPYRPAAHGVRPDGIDGDGLARTEANHV
jgi:hypothetical protein